MGAVLLAAGTIAGCGLESAATAVAEAVKPYRAARSEWAACGEPRLKLECATLTVPLDYAAPRGETIELPVIRVRATDQAHRIGSLVFNFGGPGASVTEKFAQGVAEKFKNLGTRYDLVGLEPRGVGGSARVTCTPGRQKDALSALNASPAGTEEKAALRQVREALFQGCLRRSGKILPHVGTVNAARDLDVLRAALGDRKLNYFGFSYGTRLGASYAHQFPGNVGRMVLDSAVTPEPGLKAFSLQQAAGFQQALGRFAVWADQQPRTARSRTKNTMINRITALLDRMERTPLPTQQGQTLTRSLGVAAIGSALYSEESWPPLLQGIKQAESGDGTVLLTLAGSGKAGMSESGLAIGCADRSDRYSEQDVEKALPEFTNASPIFGPYLAWGLTNCTGWPVQGQDVELDAAGAPPIVVIGTTGDPATPKAWAAALAERLGSGVVLTLQGTRHGAYPSGDTCIQRAVDAYLLHGKVPAEGITCP